MVHFLLDVTNILGQMLEVGFVEIIVSQLHGRVFLVFV
jgi:hypothetical protein